MRDGSGFHPRKKSGAEADYLYNKQDVSLLIE
jgi:hypothetical protein